MPTASQVAASRLGVERFPIVDLGPVVAGEDGAIERAAAEVRAACGDVAFFNIRNHGVPPALMDAIIAESARFHGRPMEEKLKAKVGPDLLGYLPPGGQTQRTSIYNENTRRELSASFYIRREAPPDEAAGPERKPWFYPNRWPGNLPGFKETLLAYFDALDGLTRHLLPLFSTALELGPRYFLEHPAFEPPNPTVRLLEYPSQDPDEDNLFGIGPHSDYGCITVLNPGPTPGLEILMPSGDWVAAPTMADCFLINTGQLLTRWCNDRIPATPHRVINASGGLRHSAAFLIGTQADVDLECLPSCHGPDDPPKYPPNYLRRPHRRDQGEELPHRGRRRRRLAFPNSTGDRFRPPITLSGHSGSVDSLSGWL